MRCSFGEPGTVQVSSDMPMLLMLPITRRAVSGNRLKGRAAFGQRAGNLVHEQGSGHAARLGQVRQGDIVVHHDHVDLVAEGACAFRGQTEVQGGRRYSSSRSAGIRPAR